MELGAEEYLAFRRVYQWIWEMRDKELLFWIYTVEIVWEMRFNKHEKYIYDLSDKIRDFELYTQNIKRCSNYIIIVNI